VDTRPLSFAKYLRNDEDGMNPFSVHLLNQNFSCAPKRANSANHIPSFTERKPMCQTNGSSFPDLNDPNAQPSDNLRVTPPIELVLLKLIR
jgi:hypothetical protein